MRTLRVIAIAILIVATVHSAPSPVDDASTTAAPSNTSTIVPPTNVAPSQPSRDPKFLGLGFGIGWGGFGGGIYGGYPFWGGGYGGYGGYGLGGYPYGGGYGGYWG